MLIGENIVMAVTGLMSNKMRAFLTMLGIIIGIGSVIAIMTVGDSLTSSVNDSMQSMGANNIIVSLQQKTGDEEADAENDMVFTGDTAMEQPKEEDYITEEMLTQLQANYQDSIQAVSLSENVGSGQVKDGRLYANVTVTGVNPGYFLATKTEILAGRNLSRRDYEGGKRVALVSDKLVNNMFGGKNDRAIGASVEAQVGNEYYTYTIVGVYKYEQNSMNFSFSSEKDINTALYIPIKTAQSQLHSSGGYQMVTLVTAQGVNSTDLSGKVQQFLNVYYRTNPNFQVMAFSMESMVNSFASMLSTIQVAISVIAGISLLVGGIGVMNIMLVSITERTREIGTRKALGATNQSIRMQFIIEAMIICLIGGAIGVVVGVGGGSAAANGLGYPARASVSSIVIALVFSMSIGVFFGYYPANKAAKMDPIEALRYE